MAQKDQGSFIGGFTIGLFAGAVGYFLFATDKGKKIKKQMAHEWQQAQANMPDRGQGLANFNSFRDVLVHIKDQIEEQVAESEKKSSRTGKKKTAKKQSKFKGV